MDFEYDALGRMVQNRRGCPGTPPRFVLGRAAEGVVWRLRHDLATDVGVGVARLAARETGRPILGGKPERPERLVMIERLLGAETSVDPSDDKSRTGGLDGGDSPAPGRRDSDAGAVAAARHAWVEFEGAIVGELWSID